MCSILYITIISHVTGFCTQHPLGKYLYLKGIARREEALPLGKVNYFLFVVGVESIEHSHEMGDCGVGRTSISSGISDCAWGTMLIAPQAFVECRAREEGEEPAYLKPITIKKYVLEFFGHATISEHLTEQKKLEEPDTQIIRINRDQNKGKKT